MTLPLDLVAHIVTYLDITESETDARVVFPFREREWSAIRQMWIKASRVTRTASFCVYYQCMKIEQRVNGKLHSLSNDDAAITWDNGSREWYRNGKLHRDNDLPAIVEPIKNSEYWYRNGKPHRENDRPAAITPYYKMWHRDGVPHRDGDMPAMVYTAGWCHWFRNGKLSRDDGKPTLVTDPELVRRYMSQ